MFRSRRGSWLADVVRSFMPVGPVQRRVASATRRRPSLEVLEDRTVPTAGALDPTFGLGGKVATDFLLQIPTENHAQAVAVQVINNESKIVAAGHSQQLGINDNDFAVVRYNGDGSLDASFGVGGVQLIDFFAPSDRGSAVAVQSDGKIVVAGTSNPGTQKDFAVARLNADGSLDTAFGVGGRMTIDFDSGLDTASGVAVQSDGRIVVVGTTLQFPNYYFAVARLNADGSLDASFDADGKLTINFGSSLNEAKAVAVQTIDNESKIVVAGYTYHDGTEYDFAVARLNADGSLDASFDTDGKQTIDFTSFDLVTGVAVQSDGKIVVAGNSLRSAFAVARLNADGSLDASFDADGKQTIDFGSPVETSDVAVQSDGKIVVAGTSLQGATGFDFAVARLNADGSLDASFDADGKQTIDFGSEEDHNEGLAMQPDGQMIVVGYKSQSSGTGDDFLLARLNASDGSLDATFGGDGKVSTDIPRGGDEFVEGGNSVAVQPDGKLVIVGHQDNPATGSDFAIARYNTDGSLDASFGTGGRVLLDFGAGDGRVSYDEAHAVAVQVVDGQIKIIVAGRKVLFSDSGNPGDQLSNFAVVRLNADGSLDTSFSDDGRVFVNFDDAGPTGAQAVAVQSDGKIIAAGYSPRLEFIGSSEVTTTDYAAIRLNVDGSLDATFDGDGRWSANFSVQNQPLTGWNENVTDVAVQSDGKIILAGTEVLRLNANGSFDSSFGSNGRVSSISGNAVAVQSDGKIVLAGTTFNNGSVIDFGAARLNANGSLDASFGNGGRVNIDFASPAAVAYGMVVQPDGKIVVAGTSGLTGSSDFAVARLNADGSLDASFADGGKKLIDFAPADDRGRGVALQADGKIIVAGSALHSGTGRDFVMARLLGDEQMPPPNSPPTARAGGPYFVAEGGNVLLDASASTDPDQDPSTLSYAWDLDGDGEFDDASGPIVSFSAAALDGPTSVTVSVRVTDAQGLSDTDTATVGVRNLAPTATVSAPSDAALGSLFTLTLNAADPSSADQDAGFTYLVDWGDGLTDSIGPGISGTAALASHRYDRIGVYEVAVQAVDKDGATSAAVTTTVTVSGAQVLTDPVDSSRTALFVGGTSAGDTIRIRLVQSSGNLKVLLNGVSLGTFAPTGRIIVYGQAGDDEITVGDRVGLPSLLYGNAGNDRIDGGEADCVLIGGDGNDTLLGGRGRNILIGGLGADWLEGKKGEDILVAGWTDYDAPTAANQQVLAAIHMDWLSGGLNVASWLSAATVHDDSEADLLKGGRGLDWFFANYQGDGTLDLLSDALAGEMITDLN